MNKMIISMAVLSVALVSGCATTSDVENLQNQVKFYAFQVALHDRQRVFAGAAFFTRVWLVLSVWLEPFYVEENKPHQSNGCIELRFRQQWVRKSAPSLLSAMDLLERYAKFDHLGSW